MKSQSISHRLFLLILPFLLTGCYTQFRTYDQFPIDDVSYSANYSWDEYKNQTAHEADNSEEKLSPEEEALLMQMELEEMGIYYQNYEVRKWYEEHYANKLYWEGYHDGFADGYSTGYSDGWLGSGYFPFSARYSIDRYRYLRGYTGAFDYYNFYHYPRYYSYFWFGFGSFYQSGFYAGLYNNWGYYGPYYGDYYWGYNPYYGYYVSYNNYNWNRKYSRSADLYRKGPRNSRLVNRDEYRTRGSSSLNRNSGDIRSRSNGITRTRTANSGTRSRITNGSSVGRNSSGTVGRSRGSSIGKSRSSGNDSRSRGNGSSVGKRSSNGDSGKSRTRDRNNYQSSFGQTSVRDINVSDVRSRTFTIPARQISRPDFNSRRSSIFDLFKTRSNYNYEKFDVNSYNDKRFRSVSSSSGRNKGVRSSSSKSSSRSSKVSRSSSSSKSSGSRSRSSSSSSKRSRGGN